MLVVLGLAAAAVSSLASASPGSRGSGMDRSFGGRGWVITRISGKASVAYAATVTRGGRVVIVGQATTRSGHGQIVVLRYRRDGSLDNTFGSHGIFMTALPAAKGPFIATSVAQAAGSGKLLVGGGYGLGSMLVLRLTANGRLDRTFGHDHNGLATIAAGSIAESITVQRNGGILLGGSNANTNGRPMVVARFTASGVLDRRFGSRGLSTVLFWNPNLAASAGVIGLVGTSEGGVIGSGHIDYIGSDGHGSAGIFRLSPSGRLLSAYGTGGHTEIAFTTRTGKFAQWFPCAMTGSRGAVTVTGDGSTGTGASLLTVRLTTRGLVDRSFGAAGRAVTPGLRSVSDTTCGATATAGGLTAGAGAILVQLRANGSPNFRFGRRGIATISTPPRVTINAVSPSSRRAVILAGSAGNAIFVARYRF